LSARSEALPPLVSGVNRSREDDGLAPDKVVEDAQAQVASFSGELDELAEVAQRAFLAGESALPAVRH
jgi:hypothetical protein